MLSEKLINYKNPLFLKTTHFPVFMDSKFNIPNWCHTKEEIYNIVINSKIRKNSMEDLENHIKFEDRVLKNEILSLNKDLIDPSDKITNILYSYLMYHKNKYLEISEDFNEFIIQNPSFDEIKDLGKILKSDLSLRILLLSDGTYTITALSKKLKKSVAVISIYVSKLKDLNLVRTLNNGTLKRNTTGLSFNFSSIQRDTYNL